MLRNSSVVLDRGLDSIGGNKRRCSKLGEFIQEDRDWITRAAQHATHQKSLGFVGAGLLLLAGVMLYFGSPIIAVIFAVLGAGAAGYIPWLHSPTKPLVFSYMPEHTGINEQDNNQANQKPHQDTQYEPINLLSAKASSKSSTKEDKLRATGGESQVLSFSSKSSGKKSAEKHKKKDTFDLIIELSQKPLNKVGKKLG